MGRNALNTALKRTWIFASAIALCAVLGTANIAGAGENGATDKLSEPGGFTFGAAAPKPEVHVQLHMLADSSAVVPGKPFKIGVELMMDPGWHTYYKESGEAGMPTRITWELPPGFKASELIWEKPNKFNDSGIVTYGYHDKTLIGVAITPPANVPVGTPLTFAAKVKWLSCKDVCLPGHAEASIKLPVAKTAEALNTVAFGKLGFSAAVTTLTSSAEPLPPAASTGGTTAPALSVTTAPFQKKNSFDGSVLNTQFKVAGSTEDHLNLPAYLGLAFIGGFILNFMPCVLPVISIKVLSFMQQAGDHPKRVLQLGLTFTAGIISAFMVLAGVVIAVQQAGQKVGWGFQFQYPVFLLGMSALVLLFALSLFGLFYVQLAGGTDQIDKLASKEGFTGTFFKGVLATTLSTPCSAPFLGTALGFAFSQPAWVILLIFLTISVGMAFPYVLLTANPVWMKYIPKPGVWMEKFKESMGFLLVATVVWLMWVLAQQVGINATMSAVGFLVAMSFAVWIVGRFTDLTSTSRRKAIVYTCAGVVMLSAYMGCLAPFPQLLSMQAAQKGEGFMEASALAGPSTATISGEHINWIPFTVPTLDKQLQSGKTVFIDFTADWCLTCKVNENTVLATTPVMDAMKKLNVVPLKADWTRQDPDISKLLAKFGRSGVPLYVIFPASRPTEPIVLPEVINQQLVIDKLREAGPSSN